MCYYLDTYQGIYFLPRQEVYVYIVFHYNGGY